MNKALIFTVIFIVGTLAILGIFKVLFFEQAERTDKRPTVCTMEAKLCPDGTAVGREGPNCEFAPCPTASTNNNGFVISSDLQAHINEKSEFIVVTSPELGEFVRSTYEVAGQARGQWFFEATFPIDVVDWDGRIIGQGYAEAKDEWMTPDFVPFTGTVEFNVPTNTPYLRGTFIFMKSNPSDLPKNDDALEIPVQFP